MCGFIAKQLFQAPAKLAKVEERGFFCTSPTVKAHLEEIGFSFLIGYNKTLLNPDEAFLEGMLSSIYSEYRGFAYEGVGMGLALLDNLPFNNRNRLNHFIASVGNKQKYVLHVGAGWALAKLPVNLEKVIQQYDPLLRWLVIDGYGFHQAYFHTKKYVYKTTAPNNLSPFAKQVFYQGVGRCLWFVEGTEPDRITQRINSFPEEYHADLWSGLGLAATYAGGTGKEAIEEILKLGKNYALELAQGACFAAQARVFAGILTPHTEMACQVLTSLPAIKAASLTEDCLEGLPLYDSPLAYDIWRRRIRTRINEYKESLIYM